jgi:DNA-binding XRE family transcriptional regulator
MKIYIYFLLLPSVVFSQKIRQLDPQEIRQIKTDFNAEFVEKYNSEESLKKCYEIWKKLAEENSSYSNLSIEDIRSLEYCDEWNGNPWSIPFEGCSWYCGGRIDTIYSSSEKLTSSLIHDFDYGTSWTSTLNNHITPPFITYLFKPESSRVTKIVFVNGNVKNQELYETYARAKTIKMYVNEKPFRILKLQDHKNEQIFIFDPIGTSERIDYEAMKKLPIWSIKFEIIDVFNGKTNSVAISELYFSGDGHEDN